MRQWPHCPYKEVWPNVWAPPQLHPLEALGLVVAAEGLLTPPLGGLWSSEVGCRSLCFPPLNPMGESSMGGYVRGRPSCDPTYRWGQPPEGMPGLIFRGGASVVPKQPITAYSKTLRNTLK